jgi:hypothetical protein
MFTRLLHFFGRDAKSPCFSERFRAQSKTLCARSSGSPATHKSARIGRFFRVFEHFWLATTLKKSAKVEVHECSEMLPRAKVAEQSHGGHKRGVGRRLRFRESCVFRKTRGVGGGELGNRSWKSLALWRHDLNCSAKAQATSNALSQNEANGGLRIRGVVTYGCPVDCIPIQLCSDAFRPTVASLRRSPG